MNSIAKIDFLNSVKPNNVSMAQIIRRYKLWKNPAYSELTKIGAHNTNSRISSQHLLQMYKYSYDIWYDYLTSIDLNRLHLEQKNKIQAFLSSNDYKKQNMTAEKCFNFVHNEFDNVLKGTGLTPPIVSQANNQPTIDKNGNVYSDFVHFRPFDQPKDISCRLYLNIKPENISILSEKLMKICFNRRIRLYFKLWTNDSRNDTFLIYTNYDRVQDMIDILKQIKKENPKIFEGCEKINPLLTNIDNFIGFGEEPEYKHSSFNDERSKVIDDFSKDVVEKEIIEERKRIGNFTETVITSNGDLLSIENYLIYRLEKSFLETVVQRQKDIINRKFPTQYCRWGNRAVSSYIEIENKIYRSCVNGLPTLVKQQIKEQAKLYLEGLKRGQNIRIKPIKFPTANLDLFSPANKDNYNKILNRNGYLDYEFYIDLDMQEKLFSVFDSHQRINSVITDEALLPYLERYHISSQNLSLNLETEQMLKRTSGFNVN